MAGVLFSTPQTETEIAHVFTMTRGGIFNLPTLTVKQAKGITPNSIRDNESLRPSQ